MSLEACGWRLHVAAPHDEPPLRVAAKGMMDRISITVWMRKSGLHLLPHQTGPLGRHLNIISLYLFSWILNAYMYKAERRWQRMDVNKTRRTNSLLSLSISPQKIGVFYF